MLHLVPTSHKTLPHNKAGVYILLTLMHTKAEASHTTSSANCCSLQWNYLSAYLPIYKEKEIQSKICKHDLDIEEFSMTINNKKQI